MSRAEMYYFPSHPCQMGMAEGKSFDSSFELALSPVEVYTQTFPVNFPLANMALNS